LKNAASPAHGLACTTWLQLRIDPSMCAPQRLRSFRDVREASAQDRPALSLFILLERWGRSRMGVSWDWDVYAVGSGPPLLVASDGGHLSIDLRLSALNPPNADASKSSLVPSTGRR